MARRQGLLEGKARNSEARKAVWRALGDLNLRAFSQPQVVEGNWVVTRSLCLRCSKDDLASGMLPEVGLVCLKHRRWIEGPEQDLAVFREALAAERKYRTHLAPQGAVVESPVMLLAEESALVGISRATLVERQSRLERDHPASLLVYPETVRLARLLTRTSFLDAVLGEAAPRWKRAMVEREVRAILPDAVDAENWRALARVWAMVLDLQDAVRDATWLGRTPEDRWNVLRYSGLAQAQSVTSIGVDQVM